MDMAIVSFSTIDVDQVVEMYRCVSQGTGLLVRIQPSITGYSEVQGVDTSE